MTSFHRFSVTLMRSFILAASAGLLLSLLFSAPCDAAKRRSQRQRQARQGKVGGRWKEGDVRLIRGRNRAAGTVLLFHKGKWGTVCDDLWNRTNSDVVCRQRGFSGSLRTPLKMEFGGRGKRRMWITRVQCQGNETRLLDCDYVGWGKQIRHMCPGRWRAVGVVCHPKRSRQRRHRHGRQKPRSRNARWLAKRKLKARKAAAAARRRKALKRKAAIKTTPTLKTTVKTTPLTLATKNPFDVEVRTDSLQLNTQAPSQEKQTHTLPPTESTTEKASADVPLDRSAHVSPQKLTLTSLPRDSSNGDNVPLRPFAMYADLADIPVTEKQADSAVKDSAKIAETSTKISENGKLSASEFKARSSETLTTHPITRAGMSTEMTEKTTTEKAEVTSTMMKSEPGLTEDTTTTTTKPKTQTTQHTTTSKPSTTTTASTSTSTAAKETTTSQTKSTSTPQITTTTSTTETTMTTTPTTTTATTTTTTTTTTPKLTTTEEITTTEPQTTSTQETTTTETTTTSTTPKMTTEQTTRTSSSASSSQPNTNPPQRTMTTITTTGRLPKLTSTEITTTSTTTTTTTTPSTAVTTTTLTASTTQEPTSEMASTVSGTTDLTTREEGEEGEEGEEDSSIAEGLQADEDAVLSDLRDPPELDLQLTGGRYRWEGRLEVREKGSNPGPWGTVCGAVWSLRESMVVCREMGHGYGKQALKVNYFGGTVKNTTFYSFNCTGRESTLSQCPRLLVSQDNLCLRDNMVAGVICAATLPDLVPDTEQLQQSVRLQDRPLYYLQCALEENCLASSAYDIRNNDTNWRSAKRRLLRFSTVVHNRGEAAFRPNVAKANWEWHTCHMHFHSMEVFAHYDILDKAGRRLAEGSKASFCLEDTVCDRGIQRTYDCEGFGDQGLSVNCSDRYNWDIDCQWIDISDLQPGFYTFLMEVNPQMFVAEQDFDNNVVSCMLWYSGYEAKFRECKLQSLFDYRR